MCKPCSFQHTQLQSVEVRQATHVFTLTRVLLRSCLQGSPFLLNLVLSAQKQGVKLALLSATLSPDSAASWGAHAPSRHFLDDVLQCFDLIIPASEQVGGAPGCYS